MGVPPPGELGAAGGVGVAVGREVVPTLADVLNVVGLLAGGTDDDGNAENRVEEADGGGNTGGSGPLHCAFLADSSVVVRGLHPGKAERTPLTASSSIDGSLHARASPWSVM
jgi:hypothetical protein